MVGYCFLEKDTIYLKKLPKQRFNLRRGFYEEREKRDIFFLAGDPVHLYPGVNNGTG
jgi:hypothetical protein